MYSLSKNVLKRIKSLGFSDFGIVDLDAYNPQDGLLRYIDCGHHGTMAWMEETAKRRIHPQQMWKQAKAAIVLGMNYGPDCNPLENLTKPAKGTISVYARGRDYHQLIKGRLKEVAGLLARDTGEDVKVFVDTAPLMEKPLAEAAGLGWQGKHTNLVSREFGSWLFLGVILTAAKLSPTKLEDGGCGSCRACLDICPTNAFPAPYQIDARRCISYLTIEHKGAVDENLRALMGNHIFGCDDCLAVCPWNKFAKTSAEIKFKAKQSLDSPNLQDLAKLSDDEFRTMFAGSPIKRIGRTQFLRNVLYAIGNSGCAELLPHAQAHREHENEIVRDAAHWAISRLSP